MDEETILRVFPVHIILIAVIVGLSLIYLSPLSLFLPSYITAPFSLTLPTETLSSLLIIVLFSLFIGTPMYFLKYLITGNQGLNHWLRHKSRIKIRGNYERAISIPGKDIAIYSKWLSMKEKSGYRILLQNVNFENTIICGFFMGLQLAILLLISSLLAIGAYSFVSSVIVANIGILNTLTMGIWEISIKLIFCGFAFSILWLFNKFYWNKYISDRVAHIRREFSSFRECHEI